MSLTRRALYRGVWRFASWSRQNSASESRSILLWRAAGTKFPLEPTRGAGHGAVAGCLPRGALRQPFAMLVARLDAARAVPRARYVVEGAWRHCDNVFCRNAPPGDNPGQPGTTTTRQAWACRAPMLPRMDARPDHSLDKSPYGGLDTRA